MISARYKAELMPDGAERFPSATDKVPLMTQPFPTATDKLPLMTQPFPAATDKVPLMTQRFPTGAEPFPTDAERFKTHPVTACHPSSGGVPDRVGWVWQLTLIGGWAKPISSAR